MKRTIPVCAALAALTTLAVAAGVSPAFADPAGSESLLDYTVTGSAPTLVAGGLQFDGTAPGFDGSAIDHVESVPLASVTALGYDVATAPASDAADPSYTLEVDTAGNGNEADDTTLVGDPALNGLASNASGALDASGWDFWNSALDPSADGGQDNPESLAWFNTTYPSAVVIAHGLQLSQAATTSVSVVSSTDFNGVDTDFTLGTTANPIHVATPPADGTEGTVSYTDVNAQTGIGTEIDPWTAPSSFGTVHYVIETPGAAAPEVGVSSAPTISGTVQVGHVLTANLGATTPAGATLSYQWLLNGVVLNGATAKTLTPASSAYVGKKLSVRVTAAADGYANRTATSAQTAAVKAGTLTAPTPAISGTTAVGKSLALKPGVWTSGTTLRYQWFAAGKALTGQTHGTLTLGTAEYGKAITVRVTGSKSGYTSVEKFSRATAKIGRGTLTVSMSPTVTLSSNVAGYPVVGTTLTAHSSGWTSGTALHYQWYANSTSIKGATKSTYKIPASLSGRTFFVHVTGEKTDYTSLARNSAKTKPAYNPNTASERGAIADARDYLEYVGNIFSLSGFVRQLEFDDFSALDSTYAVDSLHINWDTAAANDAREYEEYVGGFSYGSMVQQLEDADGFTAAQAAYGARAVGL